MPDLHDTARTVATTALDILRLAAAAEAAKLTPQPPTRVTEPQTELTPAHADPVGELIADARRQALQDVTHDYAVLLRHIGRELNDLAARLRVDLQIMDGELLDDRFTALRRWVADDGSPQ